MVDSSPQQKQPFKPKSKFADADEFLDAVTPSLVNNLDRAEESTAGEGKKKQKPGE